MKDGSSHWRPHYCVLVKLNVGGCVNLFPDHWVAVWWKWRSMLTSVEELEPHSIYNRRAGLGFSAAESSPLNLSQLVPLSLSKVRVDRVYSKWFCWKAYILDVETGMNVHVVLFPTQSLTQHRLVLKSLGSWSWPGIHDACASASLVLRLQMSPNLALVVSTLKAVH